MAFSAALNEGPIPAEYVDQDVVARTVRIYLTAKVSSVKELVSYLKTSVPDFDLSNCRGVWKTERYGQVYITMKDVDCAQQLLELQCVSVGSDKVYFYSYGKFMVPLRIHWLHATVRSDFLREYFSKFGKVLDVRREYETIDGVDIFSGVRIVKMELTDDEKEHIPHIVKFGDKQSMLITAPGRMPICFKCHTHGHVRSQCPRTDSSSLVSKGRVDVGDPSSSPDDMDIVVPSVVESHVPPIEERIVKRKQSVESVGRNGKKGKINTVPDSEDDASSQTDAAMAAMDIPGEVAGPKDDHSQIIRTQVPPIQDLGATSWAEQMDQKDEADASTSDDDEDDMLSVPSVHNSDVEENRDRTVVVTVPERASTEMRKIQGSRDSDQKKTTWKVDVRVTRTSRECPDVNIYMHSMNSFVKDRRQEGPEDAIVHKRLLQTVVNTKVWTNLHNYVIPPDQPFKNFTITVKLHDLAKCAKT